MCKNICPRYTACVRRCLCVSSSSERHIFNSIKFISSIMVQRKVPSNIAGAIHSCDMALMAAHRMAKIDVCATCTMPQHNYLCLESNVPVRVEHLSSSYVCTRPTKGKKKRKLFFASHTASLVCV